MNKEKEVILQVLKMYKDMPFLWDKTHPEYRNKTSRLNGHQILLEAFKKYDEFATVQTLNKKIANMRTNYYKELQKVIESRRLGAEEQDVYEPTVWYYDALNFLADRYSSEYSRQKRDPLKTEAHSSSSSEAEISFQNSEIYECSPILKKRRHTKSFVLQNASSITDVAEKAPPIKEEEWEILGKAIGLQLRGLDKEQLTITQKIISDAIYYAKFGLLTQHSCVNLGTPTLPP